MKSDTTTNAISSPESADGLSPCGGQDSKTPEESGLAPVPVSRFRALEKDRDTPTSGTCGPLFTASSPSAVLQRSLESRLRARMAVNGSPEFALTWKDWDMPAGEPICALRASARRTVDNGFTGWPTASARDWKDTPGMSETGVNPDGTERKRLDMLPRVAQLASWPTPQAHDTQEQGQAREMTATGRIKTHTGSDVSANLPMVAGWATPRAADAESAGMRHSRGVADTLSAQAGQDASRSNAETARPAGFRLNPRFSLWLMGYPAAWASCGERAMQSFQKSRRRS